VNTTESTHGPGSGRASERAFLLAALLALAVFGFFVRRFDFVCDDAFISFRYSKHLAEGHGLRYNLEGPAIEGYSNFLWVLWLALFELLRADVTVWARLSSVACGAALVVLVGRLAHRRYELGPMGVTATLLFLATLPPLTMWSTGGLATAPAALGIFMCFERLLGNPRRPRGIAAGIWGLAASLLRADAAAFVLLIFGAAGLRWLSGRERHLLRAGLVALSIVVLGTTAHVLWRHGYYGDWLPNTARVKTGFSALRLERGVNYLVAFFLTLPSCAIAFVFGLAALGRRRDTLRLTALGMVAANIGYAAYAGGDFMAMGRFMVPMLPFLALMFAGGWESFGRKRLGPLELGPLVAVTCVTLSILPCFNRCAFPESLRERFHFRWSNPVYENEFEMWSNMKKRARGWTWQGRALAQLTEPGESMIIGPIGALGYYSGLELFDTYGLTSRLYAPEDVEPQRSSPGHDRACATELGARPRPWRTGREPCTCRAPARPPRRRGASDGR
jgi:hypothetical protein